MTDGRQVGRRARRHRRSAHNSHAHKHAVTGLQGLAQPAGFEPGEVWTDENGWFAVLWLESGAP